jgi:hypothetical protein
MPMTRLERIRRMQHTQRLSRGLQLELRQLYPAELFNVDAAWEHTVFAEHRLNRVCHQYERGEATKEDVVTAGEAWRIAWREAAELYGTTPTDKAA